MRVNSYSVFFFVNFHLLTDIIISDVPNAGSGLKNLSRRLQWDKDLRNYLKSLDEKKPVIVCGDMNVSHQPIGKFQCDFFN